MFIILFKTPAGHFLQGKDLFALLLVYVVTIPIATLLTLLGLYWNCRSWKKSLVVVSIIFVITSLIGTFRWQNFRYQSANLASSLEEKNKEIAKSIFLGEIRWEMGCPTTHDQLTSRYGKVFEKLNLFLPVEVTTTGTYRFIWEFSPQSNNRRPFKSEVTKDLAAGAQEIQLTYDFKTWGLFVESASSTLTVAVDRFADSKELYGEDLARQAQAFLMEKESPKTYRPIMNKNYSIPVDNVLVTSMKSLVCPL
ncbi:MAG: hypothetical protein WCG27_07890 [Pseudomonadota bacterium]